MRVLRVKMKQDILLHQPSKALKTHSRERDMYRRLRRNAVGNGLLYLQYLGTIRYVFCILFLVDTF